MRRYIVVNPYTAQDCPRAQHDSGPYPWCVPGATGAPLAGSKSYVWQVDPSGRTSSRALVSACVTATSAYRCSPLTSLAHMSRSRFIIVSMIARPSRSGVPSAPHARMNPPRVWKRRSIEPAARSAPSRQSGWPVRCQPVTQDG